MKLRTIQFSNGNGKSAAQYFTLRDSAASEILQNHAEWAKWEDYIFCALFDDRTLGRIAHSRKSVTIYIWQGKQKSRSGVWTTDQRVRVEVFLGGRRIANRTGEQAEKFHNS